MLYIHGDTIPYLFDSACTLYGAQELKVKYKLINYIPANLSNKDVCVGSVDFVKESFSKLNIKYHSLPNSNRSYIITSLEESMTLGKVFIKPVTMKLFTGFLYEGYKYSCLENVPLDTQVYVYDSLDILSEWRLYIYQNEVLGAYNYSGDPLLFPDKDYLDNTRINLKTRPISYVIDIGILRDKSHVVIEFNDMFAIGNYGLPNYLYTKCLIARYREIIQTHGKHPTTNN